MGKGELVKEKTSKGLKTQTDFVKKVDKINTNIGIILDTENTIDNILESVKKGIRDEKKKK